MRHPLFQFLYCPVCGAKTFVEHNEKSKRCETCGFVYYFNPSSAVACFIKNAKGELLLVRRGKEPAKGTLDLPGGFVDMSESGEEAACREVREETGLRIRNCRYLFSLPNLYMYSGFEVHTLDMFYECLVDTFDNVQAADDAAEIVILRPEDVNPDDFGLGSIRKSVPLYLGKY
ncbi:MAG: NUDIX domain-containing protein [Parabacteroides sp.]|nr:NUDIX domain-containing protein [Parabacteroides sp.]